MIHFNGTVHDLRRGNKYLQCFSWTLTFILNDSEKEKEWNIKRKGSLNCLKTQRRKSVITERKRCGKIRTTPTASFIIFLQHFSVSRFWKVYCCQFEASCMILRKYRVFRKLDHYMKVLTIQNIKFIRCIFLYCPTSYLLYLCSRNYNIPFRI